MTDLTLTDLSAAEPYKSLTAIKPVTDPLESGKHPAHVTDPDDPSRFYTYPWSVVAEAVGTGHILAMVGLLFLLATLVFIMMKSSCFKYFSFFVFDRHYERLKLKQKRQDNPLEST